MTQYRYHANNSVQRDLDDVFRITGGQIVHLRVDWAKRLGSIHAALVLQQLIFRGRLHADQDGWFYVTAEVMEDETAVGEKGYAAARRKLLAESIIQEERRGLPRRLWMRFDLQRLLDWVDETPTVRERIQSRQLSEQEPRNIEASPETPTRLPRQSSEQLTKHNTRQENEVDRSSRLLPIWQRLDPVADRDVILGNRHERPELPWVADVTKETHLAWAQVQAAWDRLHSPKGRRR